MINGLNDLRKKLPEDTDKAINELKRIIKGLPPKECYFNSIDDFVAPFTCTCEEEFLMQLLLIEKDENNEKDKEYMDFYELNKKLSDMMNSYKNLTEEEKKVLKTEMEEIYKKQAEEGYIRKYFYRETM
jgi:hypothetical protein